MSPSPKSSERIESTPNEDKTVTKGSESMRTNIFTILNNFPELT
jgi:hypothetical protein